MRNYPDSMPDDLVTVTADAWMFVGAMENHRSVLDALNASPRFGKFCGPSREALNHLRAPKWLASRLSPLNCYPSVVMSKDGLASAAEERGGGNPWLQKPLASGGGRGIFLLDPSAPWSVPDEPSYWQQRIDGISLSALFVCSETGCRLLWVSQQCIGWTVAAAPTDFTYCGSIGPWPVSECQSKELLCIAETAAHGLSYRGLLGIDLIWDGRKFWVIEINPRYTASCELWELSTGISAVAEHLQAFDVQQTDTTLLRIEAKGDRNFIGKLIVYADRDLITPDLQRFLSPRPPWSIPWLADIPQTGVLIPRGAPICTVFATAATPDDCEKKLRRRAECVRRILIRP